MFTDIVTSTDLIGVMGDDAWAELLAWHNRELRSSFSSHRGEEVKSTGDGFFVTFDHAGEAIECAVDIQQRLMRHRREHGFAPSVRIGLHAGEATRDGRDYGGRGVHIAARVGGAASGHEILVTTEVLEQAGHTRFKASEPRALTLKGVREPSRFARSTGVRTRGRRRSPSRPGLRRGRDACSLLVRRRPRLHRSCQDVEKARLQRAFSLRPGHLANGQWPTGWK